MVTPMTINTLIWLEVKVLKHDSLFYLEKKWDERSHPLVLFTAQPQSEWMMRGEVWGWHLRPITFQTLYNSSRFCLYTGPTRGDFTIHRNHYLTFSVLAIFSFPCIKIRFELQWKRIDDHFYLKLSFLSPETKSLIS